MLQKKHFSAIFISIAFVMYAVKLTAQEPDPRVEKVYIIFKTHLDIGFTQLSSQVEQRYITEFIPKAIAIAEELRAAGGTERYVWTTGAWLIDAYLRQADPNAVLRLKAAITRGDIVWNGVPYTVESETMTREMFETILKLSAKLDQQFGKKTTAAKMTDVPGHTRGIVSQLHDAGMRFLQIGVNSAATVPDVPPVCLWRNVDGKEIVLMYQKTYGDDMLLPNGKTVVSINFTNDNKGPHTIQRVRQIYADLAKKYPNARLSAASLNDVSDDLQRMTGLMPVLTSEIGDTWIYGYGSSPVRMSKYRELSRLYGKWLHEGKLDKDSDIAIAFAVRLGMIAEHTWGLDVKEYLKNWDKYDVDIFNRSRNLPEFRLMEASWKEIDDNIEKAIDFLPDDLRQEADAAIGLIGEVSPRSLEPAGRAKEIDDRGALRLNMDGRLFTAGTVAYQTFSAADYKSFQHAYLTRTIQWALEDNGKPGLENTRAVTASLEALKTEMRVERREKEKRIVTKLSFPADSRIDPLVLPADMEIEYIIHKDKKTVEMNFSLIGKPANRLPEAYWLSVLPENVVSAFVEKMGYPVNVLDVVRGGNRQMHAIDNYVDVITNSGTVRIVSMDAPLVAIGERNALNYSSQLPDPTKGIHFCLFNNLWGTNFSMWWEGSVTYRFRIEML